MCLVGVVVRRYVYRFPHITYPYSSCICSFLQQHPYFLFIKKKSIYNIYIQGSPQRVMASGSATPYRLVT